MKHDCKLKLNTFDVADAEQDSASSNADETKMSITVHAMFCAKGDMMSPF